MERQFVRRLRRFTQIWAKGVITGIDGASDVLKFSMLLEMKWLSVLEQPIQKGTEGAIAWGLTIALNWP
jgi:hypothetical protein